MSDGLLPYYLYSQLDCFIRAIQYELAFPQAIGSSLMCVSMHTAGSDPGFLKNITDYRLPDISMLFQGLLIWAFAWLLSLAFAFYLVDATVRLGIVGALMPFLIACWPFKITSKYTNQGFTMFMNTFFTYVFMGLVITINMQLMGVSLTGGKGGLEAIESALNGNKVSVLKDLLDIGFAGFLILIASCIFGFKICGQASELAGSMAGGGGGSSLAPEIGGMGYNVAKAATLGTGKAVWGGTKFVGEATGVNEKLRKFGDKAVNKLVVSPLANVFSFGRSGGGAAKKTTPSQTQKTQTSPTANGNGGTPVTPDQARQADDVVNANPRTTTAPQTAPDATNATTAQQNQRQAQTGGSSGRTASTQTNGSTGTTPKPHTQNASNQPQTDSAHTGTVAGNSRPVQQPSVEELRKQALKEFESTNAGRALEQAIGEQNTRRAECRQRASELRDKLHGANDDVLFYENAARDQKASPEFRANMQAEANKAKQQASLCRQQIKQAEDELKQCDEKLNALNGLKTDSANSFADSRVASDKTGAYDEKTVLDNVNRIIGKK